VRQEHRAVTTETGLLSPREVADWLQITEATLRQWKHRGRGPRVVKVGGALRYRPCDVENWLNQQTVDPAAKVAS
jgi:predicted DNA-binding transcriptional regulator AlpA